MKSSLLALFALATLASALSGGMNSMHAHQRMIKRSHARIARSPRISEGAYSKRAAAHRRSRMSKRKTPGSGDSTTAPSNIADGTATSGCAVWHTVSDGEVCLGLIDKSTIDMAKFLQLNPSLNAACSNLVTGQAYCVDVVAGDDSSNSASTPVQNAVAPVNENTTPSRVTAADTSADDEEECTDEEESASESGSDSSSGDDGDSEDCDSEDDGDDTTDSTDPTDGEEECEEEDNEVSTFSAPASNSNQPQADSSNDSSDNSQDQDSSDSSDNQDGSNDSTSDSNSSDSPSSGKSSGGKVLSQFQGTATYYYQNGNAGNCGTVHSDSDYIVALFTPVYGDGSHCGKSVQLTNTANGNTVTARVEDSCPSCETNGNIDLSEAVFKQLSDNNLGLGVLDVKWGFV